MTSATPPKTSTSNRTSGANSNFTPDAQHNKPPQHIYNSRYRHQPRPRRADVDVFPSSQLFPDQQMGNGTTFPVWQRDFAGSEKNIQKNPQKTHRRWNLWYSVLDAASLADSDTCSQTRWGSTCDPRNTWPQKQGVEGMKLMWKIWPRPHPPPKFFLFLFK